MSGSSLTARALLDEADRLHMEKRFEDASRHYALALAKNAHEAQGWYGLGCAQASLNEHGQALEALRRAVKLSPDDPRPRAALAQSLFALGHVSAALREYALLTRETEPVLRDIGLRNLACVAPGDPALDNAAILRLRRLWAESQTPSAPFVKPAWRPGRKLKIGYLGSYFSARNWMKMYMGVINAHDRDAFEINLIVDGDLPSAGAGYRDHPQDRIWEVDGVSNEELAGHIIAAQLDVVVDLLGYSNQDRMPVMLYPLAPVRMAWSGMYGTTGFDTLDCVIADAWTVPPGEERFCAERVRRVPGTYLAFDVFYPTPDAVPPPWLSNGHVTFGSLISGYKITDAVIASWSRILRGVPGAGLLLRNRALEQGSNRAEIAARFAANGVAADRLILEGGDEHLEFLRTYDRIDIALDAFPYSGGTTTAEAIWQGVPVLTFNGDRWAARTSRSILMAAGLGDWVADDQAGFEAMAIRMGRAPETLAASRNTLRARIAASAACDTKGLCRALEAIYREEAGEGAGTSSQDRSGNSVPIPEQEETRHHEAPLEDRRGHFIHIEGNGIFIDIDRYSSLLVEHLTDDVYESRERMLVRNLLRPDDRVLDIGTAVGAVAMAAARIVGAANVMTYEANPEIAADARRNFSHNGLAAIHSYVGVLENRACFKASSVTRDFFISRDFWASRLFVGADGTDIIGTIRVPTLCLENQIAEHRATVIICDIEGGEVDLLTGAGLAGIRLLIIELHHWAVGQEAADVMIRFLVTHGFNVDLYYSGGGMAVLRR